MHKFDVEFEIFNGAGYKANMTVSVEAGNKKLAIIRAMGKIGTINNGQFANDYKVVKRVDLVA